MQVSESSQERGQLLADVWGGHSTALASALLSLQEQATSFKAR